MKRLVLAAVIVLILIAVGAWFILKPGQKTSNTNTQTSQNTSSGGSSQNAPDTIVYDGNGFSPSTLTVKAGTKVTIKNTSSEALQMDSNPHPVHTDDTDLNVGAVDPGGSQAFTVTKTGTFGYHNHLDPSQQGTIIIQ